MKTKLLILILALMCTWKINSAQTVQLWGTATRGGNSDNGVIFSINSDGSDFNVNYFMVNSLGSSPYTGLFEASNGKFYGATEIGGANNFGAIFSYDPVSGSYTDLYDLDSIHGELPLSTFMQATDGKIYSTTAAGGANGLGVIFSFDPSNNQYVDRYDLAVADGNTCELSGLVQASNGKLYGTAPLGGTNGFGDIFSFNPSSNQFEDIHDFDSTNGYEPVSALVQISNLLYGTTVVGGANGQGVIFSFNLSNSQFANLFDFVDSTGMAPANSLLNSNGDLIGTTQYGGADITAGGTIFSFNTSSNKYSVLYNFPSSNGDDIAGPLLQTADGKIYGIAFGGGASGNGTIYCFNPANSQFKLLHSFDGANGAGPASGLYLYNVMTAVNTVPKNSFSVFPNPSQGQIRVSSSSLVDEIKITNELGQVVKQIRPDQLVTNVKIETAGTYFISLISQNQSSTQKVFIVK